MRDAARGGDGEGRPQSFTRCAICDTLLYNARQRAIYARPPLAEGEEKKATEILYGPLAARSHTRTTWTFLPLPFFPLLSLVQIPTERSRHLPLSLSLSFYSRVLPDMRRLATATRLTLIDAIISGQGSAMCA